MKAFLLTRYGSNQQIQAADVPEPLVNADDVLIQVQAASVNPVDLKIRDGQLKQVLPLIAFDEGPKKFFEAGKGFLGKSKTAEALKQFDECISSGAILQNRSPEIKERKFEVAGGSTSLPELIQACIAQKKALKGK